MAAIYGINGFGKLSAGYPVNVNDMQIKTFTVASTAPTDGIAPGDLLIYTAKTNEYSTPSTLASSSDISGKVAGIATATNVKLDTTFPQGSSVNYMAGQAGGCATRGTIAVKLHGNAPAEGDAVYYDITNQAFTKTSTSNVAMSNMIFAGITDGSLTAITIRY